MASVSIDGSRCNGCGRCVDICPANYEMGADGKARATGAFCFTCGHCVAACPTDAISNLALDASEFEPLDESARLGYDHFLDFLRMRRSRREYRDDPVPREAIDKLLRAAVEAPSAINSQSIEYTVITDRETITRLSERTAVSLSRIVRMISNPVLGLGFRLLCPKVYSDMVRYLPMMERVLDCQRQGMDMILYNAPCVILLHAPKTEMMAHQDAVFSTQNILLAAETLGLGACVIGFVTEPANRDPQMRRIAGIPRGHRVLSTVIVGYPKFRYSRSVPKKQPTVHYVAPEDR